ncbi:MAG: hypothetical protein EZS26_002229 [Candidatus Ordinivivax streblomastigis]|uniref:Cadherin-like beta-sandwich-like domain-containing protein n=1 Tax=Candidatus Ordinivivax streblomastigis TaxID=2540710 RepID=A0A5M8NZM7_9BACT|nr:MAG: hypothetical protein EZS26_002229 [Candidatus Ordinivivax streblomastigis]
MKTFKQIVLAATLLCGMQGAYAQPSTQAPTPTHAPSDVISTFSDYYTNVGKSLEPVTSWAQNPITTIETYFSNDKVAKVPTGDSPVNTSGWNGQTKGYIHMDVYATSASATFYYGIANGYDLNGKYPTSAFVWPALKANQWVSVDVPMAEFIKGGFNKDQNIQGFRFRTAGGPVYIDNIYAYGYLDPGELPVEEADIPQAPQPLHSQADVRAVFSDSYTLATKGYKPQTFGGIIGKILPVKGFPNDQVVEFKTLGTSLATIDTWKITGLIIHVDVYHKSDGDGSFSFGLCSQDWSGNQIKQIPGDQWNWDIISEGEWVGLDVPAYLFADAGVNLEQITQIKFFGSGLFYIDNLYAYAGQILNRDATLKSLSITSAELAPGFSGNVTEYETRVAEGVASVTINAEVNAVTSHLTGTGVKTLTADYNEFEVVVTAEAGNTKTYKIIVNRGEPKDNNATLRSLVVSNGVGTTYTPTPAFNPGVAALTYNVPADLAFVVVEAVTGSDKATFSGLSGLGFETLQPGVNPINIVVTAESGLKRTYALTINRGGGNAIRDVKAAPVLVKTGNGVLEASFEGSAHIRLYTVTGQLIDQTVANGAYVHPVGRGVYILSVDGGITKVLVK